ncbi:MAG TPA: SDR family NAD(P)-dependent oxidoreductase [Solirubrobacteraceae bacterium]
MSTSIRPTPMMPGTAIVTGATSGLGYECSRVLLSKGWHVVMAVRDLDRGRAAARALDDPDRCVVMRADLGSLASVRAFVDEYRGAGLPPARAVICNAALQVVSETRSSEDGYELTFAVNHLGHFALVQGLLDQLARPSRIVIVSSGTHDPDQRTGMPAPLDTSAERLAHPEAEADEPVARLGRRRYTTSKLCNVLFAYELDRRLRDGGSATTVNLFDPGLMPGSGLARDYTGPQRLAWRFVLPVMRVLPHVHTARTSGRNLAALAGDERFADVSGKYFLGLDPVSSSADSNDLAKAADLWETSERLIAAVGLTGESLRG